MRQTAELFASRNHNALFPDSMRGLLARAILVGAKSHNPSIPTQVDMERDMEQDVSSIQVISDHISTRASVALVNLSTCRRRG